MLSDGKALPYQFGLATANGFREHSHIMRKRTKPNQLVNIYMITKYFIEIERGIKDILEKERANFCSIRTCKYISGRIQVITVSKFICFHIMLREF